jgi:hypothetical protein
MSIYLERVEENKRLVALGLDAMDSTFGQYSESLWDEPTITGDLMRFQERQSEGAKLDPTFPDMMTGEPQPSPFYEPSAKLSDTDANEQFGIPGHLSFSGQTTRVIAQQLFDQKRAELARQDVYARYKGGIGSQVAGFGIGLVSQALAPVNVAASFLPVVGPARYALWAERFGAVGARAAVGAVEGIAGSVAIEPLQYALAQDEQRDYTAADSLLNVTFGAIIGSGFHVGAGAIGDRISRPAAMQRAANASPEANQAALGGSIAAIIENRPVVADDALRMMAREDGPRGQGDGGETPRADTPPRLGVDGGYIREISDGTRLVPKSSELAETLKALRSAEDDAMRAAGWTDADIKELKQLNRVIDRGGLSADAAIADKNVLLLKYPEEWVELDIPDEGEIRQLLTEFSSLERVPGEDAAVYADGIARVLKRYIGQIPDRDPFALAVFRKAFSEAREHGLDTKALSDQIFARYLGQMSKSDQEFMRAVFAEFQTRNQSNEAAAGQFETSVTINGETQTARGVVPGRSEALAKMDAALARNAQNAGDPFDIETSAILAADQRSTVRTEQRASLAKTALADAENDLRLMEKSGDVSEADIKTALAEVNVLAKQGEDMKSAYEVGANCLARAAA